MKITKKYWHLDISNNLKQHTTYAVTVMSVWVSGMHPATFRTVGLVPSLLNKNHHLIAWK